MEVQKQASGFVIFIGKLAELLGYGSRLPQSSQTSGDAELAPTRRWVRRPEKPRRHMAVTASWSGRHVETWTVQAPTPTDPNMRSLGEQGAAVDELKRKQVSQLIKNALEARTPEAFLEFLEFTTRFRRLSVWNARMAQIQRRGARAIASEHEWHSIGRKVAADAVPIIILWPFGPIRYVYEIGDTLPAIDRSSIGDPFATEGSLRPGVMDRLALALRHQKHFRVDVELRRFGHALAGSVAGQGTVALGEEGEAVPSQGTLGSFAKNHAATTNKITAKGVPSYRVLINDRLTEPQQFVTLAHELGHMFCGHLGACHGGRSSQQESGWPDRRALGHNEREIEAEAVAYIVAKRAGIVIQSVDYLASHAKAAKLDRIDADLVVRAAARIERLAKLRYGCMDFGSEPAGM
jgi:hypothetical protein